MFYRLTLPSGIFNQGLFGLSRSALKSSQCFVTGPVVIELGGKVSVSHFMKGHAEVQLNGVDLLSLVQSADQVINCCYEPGFTRPYLSEAILLSNCQDTS